jgi:hypothetical protein
MPLQQLRKEVLMDWDLTPVECRQLLLVVINQNHLMTEVRKTGPRNQTNVSGTHHSNLHQK